MAAGSGKWRGALSIQAMPVLAMALVVLLLGVLLGLLRQNEHESRAQTLSQDVMWVEQGLHFHLTAIGEGLVRLADRVAREGVLDPGFLNEGGALITAHPELRRIVLRDADGTLRFVAPPNDPLPRTEVAPDWYDGFALTPPLGQPAYGRPYWLPHGGGVVMAVSVPVLRQGQPIGLVSATLSLDRLLAEQVPWWFAQKYRIEILDENGAVLAERTRAEPDEPGLVHLGRLDPPGAGLSIRAIAYSGKPDLARTLLAAAIFALALSAILSLWALRRHQRRRLAAEQALRAEHAFRKAMEEALTIGMRARDLDGRVTYVNSAFCRMVGRSPEELIGAAPPMPYWAPEEVETYQAMFNSVQRGEAPDQGFELTLCRRNGERFHVLVYETPLIDSEGRQSGWMASVVDITERERAADLSRQQQDRLQRTARLITMGEMASTLAHEINQPLSAIASYATGCLNRLASGNASPAELEAPLMRIGAQAQRAGQIIRRIHDFVRKSTPLVAPCAVNRVIEGAIGFVEADARKHGIRVIVLPDPVDPQVEADRILIEQVVLNLARNAIEAMSNTPWFLREIEVSIGSGGGMVTVRVADHGGGIPPEVAQGLFTPFFSTKEEGMGMGLNICRSIIESHRGRLWHEPNPGGGSIFVFTLPEKDGPA